GRGPPPSRAPARQAPAPAAGPAVTRPTFPVVRRGGYDTAAVDRHVQAVSGLAASLEQARATITALESRLEEATTRLAENENPTYAGLGGRASEMLRLAEEQADDVLVQAKAQAEDIRRQAARDAE